MKIDMLMEKFKKYQIVVLFLFGSSFAAAVLDYKDLLAYLFPSNDETVFSGSICANRGEDTDCQENNEMFMEFLYKNSGTGQPIELALKYLFVPDWEDPCGQSGTIEGNGNYIADGWTGFVFQDTPEDSLVFNSFGDCTSRPNVLLFKGTNFPINIVGQNGEEMTYILSGRFIVTMAAMGTMDRQITFTEFKH